MERFTYTPSFPAKEISSTRLRRTVVPSYEQRTISGINPLVESWDLTFQARGNAERDDICNFFQGLRGVDPFQWTTLFRETACFVCPKWNLSLDSCGISTISATFELQYVPGGPNLRIAVPPTSATPFVWIPDYSAKNSYDTRARVTSFGDGYKQRVLFGLSPQEETWSLSFRNRVRVERDQIRQYLRAARGVTAFLWTDPRTDKTGKYVCEKWTTDYLSAVQADIQATFRRVYEP